MREIFLETMGYHSLVLLSNWSVRVGQSSSFKDPLLLLVVQQTCDSALRLWSTACPHQKRSQYTCQVLIWDYESFSSRDEITLSGWWAMQIGRVRRLLPPLYCLFSDVVLRYRFRFWQVTWLGQSDQTAFSGLFTFELRPCWYFLDWNLVRLVTFFDILRVLGKRCEVLTNHTIGQDAQFSENDGFCFRCQFLMYLVPIRRDVRNLLWRYILCYRWHTLRWSESLGSRCVASLKSYETRRSKKRHPWWHWIRYAWASPRWFVLNRNAIHLAESVSESNSDYFAINGQGRVIGKQITDFHQ